MDPSKILIWNETKMQDISRFCGGILWWLTCVDIRASCSGPWLLPLVGRNIIQLFLAHEEVWLRNNLKQHSLALAIDVLAAISCVWARNKVTRPKELGGLGLFDLKFLG
ncbi:hypothetical protein ACJX0J_041407, partial [Zea mays]